jgi:hypothetical protein
MRAVGAALAAAALLVPSTAPGLAHHSAIAFDFSKLATVQGVVKQFEVVNPHAHIVLSVTDEKGTRDVAFEGHSRNNFYRGGWRPDSVAVGDTIRITYAVRRDGADGGYVTSFVTAQGKPIGLRQ